MLIWQKQMATRSDLHTFSTVQPGKAEQREFHQVGTPANRDGRIKDSRYNEVGHLQCSLQSHRVRIFDIRMTDCVCSSLNATVSTPGHVLGRVDMQCGWRVRLRCAPLKAMTNVI